MASIVSLVTVKAKFIWLIVCTKPSPPGNISTKSGEGIISSKDTLISSINA